MTETYKPAERMSAIIMQFLRDQGYVSTLDATFERRPREQMPQAARISRPDIPSRMEPGSGFRQKSDYNFNVQDSFSVLDSTLKLDVGSSLCDYMTDQDFMSFMDSADNIGVGLNFMDGF